MGRINVLDRNMVNMIAAGEVIERPASVVKELMENSIDAGATRISVVIEEGGRKLISVIDNGCGMDTEDLKKAFEPHATSKISSDSDLHNIATLGFRGEALASIGSVAQVKAVSKIPQSDSANSIAIDCGEVGVVTPCSGDYGSTIQIRDLFYKLPARRKFLRTANTEMSHIREQFTRMALANSNLDMTLTHNGREVHRLTSGQGLLGRISELFSTEIAQGLIETRNNEKGLNIFGLLGTSEIARSNNKFQYVFLNGRFIRDKFISHAVREAYRGLLGPERFPVVFIFLEIPFEDVDVNVHPTKIEVRFYNSNLVHSQILGCLREKLLGTNFDISGKLPDPGSAYGTQSKTDSIHREKVADAMAEFFKRHRPVHSQMNFGSGRGSGFAGAKVPAGGTTEAIASRQTELDRPGRSFMQIHDSFIVAQSDEGFVIVDQHALHERLMYENLRQRVGSSNLESQRLLIPESFELTDTQAEAARANTDILEKLGIELAPFGPRTMAVQSFPVLLGKAVIVDFVLELLDLLSDKGPQLNAEALLDEVLNMAACKAAIKAGQKLSDSEIEALLAAGQNSEKSSRCPHGRPTTIRFTMEELTKQFKRT